MLAAAARHASGCLSLIAALMIAAASGPPQRVAGNAYRINAAFPAVELLTIAAPAAISVITPTRVVTGASAIPIALDFGALRSTPLLFTASPRNDPGFALNSSRHVQGLDGTAIAGFGAESAFSDGAKTESDAFTTNGTASLDEPIRLIDPDVARSLVDRHGRHDVSAFFDRRHARNAASSTGAAMRWLLADLDNGGTLNLRLGADLLLIDDTLPDAKYGYEPETYVFAGFGFSY